MALLKRFGAAVLLCALGALPAAAQATEVGRVTRAAPEVKGRHNGPPQPLQVHAAVFQGMEVETFRRAGARIAINTHLPHRKGMVVLGPRTRVEFTDYVVDAARGLPVEMSWRVKLGNFRVALWPRPEGSPPGEGEYVIRTGPEDDPRSTEIRMAGTDVAVSVARNGATTVWVLDGEVTVKGPAGEPVQVPAGYRTRVPRHGRPEPPVRFDRTPEPLPDLLPHSGEVLFPDPPRLDLRRLRLDLPQ